MELIKELVVHNKNHPRKRISLPMKNFLEIKIIACNGTSWKPMAFQILIGYSSATIRTYLKKLSQIGNR
ncbi:hypothetical protein HZS_4820 [Henneguya salminicola]|nr:hypothetical protein HZS_4820 [Henneguya salminicola]